MTEPACGSWAATWLGSWRCLPSVYGSSAETAKQWSQRTEMNRNYSLEFHRKDAQNAKKNVAQTVSLRGQTNSLSYKPPREAIF
ncbi:MAG: hypothetical protein Fur0021_29700 [Candidatus Promineifilaceae bacterium]